MTRTRIPAWRRQQLAQEDEQQLAQGLDQVGNLLGLDGHQGGQDYKLLGWCLPDILRGRGHVCLPCSPDRPSRDWRPVYKGQLAGDQACTGCGRALSARRWPGPGRAKEQA